MWRGRPRPRLWECITVLKECLANRKRLRRPNLFHGPINYGLQFPRVLHLTPFGENFPRFVGRVPGGISHLFFGVNCLLSATPPVTDGCDLERQSKFRTRRPHVCTPPIWMLSRRYFRNVKVQQKRCNGRLPRSYYVRLAVARSQRKSVVSWQFPVLS